MNEEEIEKYIVSHFKDVYPIDAWGERAFFINPEKRLKRGSYFCTLKSADGENDCASDLDRKDVYRLNMGLSKSQYLSIFGKKPTRPAKGGVIEGAYDFTQIDELLPHPVYGWMGWVSILNPSKSSFEKCIPLLENAYEKALALTKKKLRALT